MHAADVTVGVGVKKLSIIRNPLSFLTHTDIQLTQHSLRLVRENKSLLFFSIASAVIRFILFTLGMIPVAQFEWATWHHQPITLLHYCVFFSYFLFFLYCLNCISLLFHAALSASVMTIIQQEKFTLAAGFAIMKKRFFHLVSWAFMMVFGRIIIRTAENWYDSWPQTKIATQFFSGLKWKVATYFVLPMMVMENKNGIRAIKHSAHIIKTKWGTELIATARINFVLFVAKIMALLPLMISVAMGDKTTVLIGSAITVILFLLMSIIYSATQLVLISALYLFATNQTHSTHYFSDALLQSAFQRK